MRAEGRSAGALLLLHGWPGSIYEFAELIEPLTDPERHGGGPAWTDMPAGGHFPALEQPQRLLNEIRNFFQQVQDENNTP